MRYIRFALLVSLVLIGVALARASARLEEAAESPFPVTRTLPYRPSLGLNPPADELTVRVEDGLPLAGELWRGETLGSLLSGFDLSPVEIHRASLALAERLEPRALKAGQAYTAYFGERGFSHIRFVIGDEGRLELRRAPDLTWSTSFVPFVRSVRRRSVAGGLDGSLEGSIRDAGGAPLLAYKMADVLQWDLDFNRDLQPGDRFEVLFEEVDLDGRYYGLGEILALVYWNQDREHRAYRFGEDGAYYDAEGKPLRKMFLVSPLKYSRVTSRFSNRRFHPVLKRYRPHHGVDYGAPVGTPVRVTANGVVTFAGWDRGGGKTVKVRHPNGYLSAYLHLSKFGKEIRPGKRVSQGEVIAYTGSTGLSSGPHLDYRVQKNGRWIDPLAIERVPAEPIPEAKRAEFESQRDQLARELSVGTAVPGARLASSVGERAADPGP